MGAEDNKDRDDADVEDVEELLKEALGIEPVRPETALVAPENVSANIRSLLELLKQGDYFSISHNLVATIEALLRLKLSARTAGEAATLDELKKELDALKAKFYIAALERKLGYFENRSGANRPKTADRKLVGKRIILELTRDLVWLAQATPKSAEEQKAITALQVRYLRVKLEMLEKDEYQISVPEEVLMTFQDELNFLQENSVDPEKIAELRGKFAALSAAKIYFPHLKLLLKNLKRDLKDPAGFEDGSSPQTSIARIEDLFETAKKIARTAEDLAEFDLLMKELQQLKRQN